MEHDLPLLIFDIDGTLVNSGEITLGTVHEVVSRFQDLTMPQDDVILGTFGMSEESMWQVLMPGGSVEQRRQGSSLYDELIVKRLYEKDVLLPNAREVLKELQARGYLMTTASNCEAPYLNAVLNSQHIGRFFDHPLCLGMVNGAVKADILSVHLKNQPNAQACMIGDRSSDVEAAKVHRIPVIGCSFGFGSEEELKEADRIIHSLTELLEIFPNVGS